MFEHAKWIAREDSNEIKPAPLFRKTFALKKDVKNAVLRICGLGLACCYINGKNVMNLTPFIKRADGFSYQNEFRFCAETDNEELLELDTHTSFQDIAIPIRLQEFANTISLKNGLFYFQVDQSNEGNRANS